MGRWSVAAQERTSREGDIWVKIWRCLGVCKEGKASRHGTCDWLAGKTRSEGPGGQGSWRS